MEYVYEVNETDVRFFDEKMNVTIEPVLIQPNGFCKKMSDFDVMKDIDITSDSNLRNIHLNCSPYRIK